MCHSASCYVSQSLEFLTRRESTVCISDVAYPAARPKSSARVTTMYTFQRTWYTSFASYLTTWDKTVKCYKSIFVINFTISIDYHQPPTNRKKLLANWIIIMSLTIAEVVNGKRWWRQSESNIDFLYYFDNSSRCPWHRGFDGADNSWWSCNLLYLKESWEIYLGVNLIFASIIFCWN